MDQGKALKNTDPLKAYAKFRGALFHADSLKNPVQCARASESLGMLQLDQGNLDLALQSFQEALGTRASFYHPEAPPLPFPEIETRWRAQAEESLSAQPIA